MDNFETYNPSIEDDNDGFSSRTYKDLSGMDDNIRPGSQGTQGGGRKPRTVKRKKVKSKVPGLGEKITFFLADGRTKAIIGIAALLFGIYLLLAFISYITDGFHDQSEVQNVAVGTAKAIANTAGEGGARLSELLINNSFGLASGVIILWLIGIALKQFGLLRFKIVNFTIKCLVALVTTSLIIGLATIGLDSHFLWGGAHGYFVNERIIHHLGWAGAALLCILLIALFFVICLYDIYKYFMRIAAKRKAEKEARRLEEEKRAELERKIADLRALEEEQAAEEIFYDDESDRDLTFEMGSSQDADVPLENDIDEEVSCKEESDLDAGEDDKVALHKVEDTSTDTSASGEEEVHIETAGGLMTVTANEIGKAVDDNATPNVYDPTAELSHFQFPSYSLLRESTARISVDQDEQMENQDKIRNTLADFGIGITDIHATVGPTVTLYEIRPDKGVKIAKIRNLGDDIALSLAAIGVRIIAPIPVKGPWASRSQIKIRRQYLCVPSSHPKLTRNASMSCRWL